MDSGMISKIQKAKRYAQERERIRFVGFEVSFRGDHNAYTVSYNRGQWHCGCHFFARRGICSHTMALERVLGEMLTSGPETAAPSSEAEDTQNVAGPACT